MNFEECEIEFNRYVNNFDMNNEKISRKYYHTYRVVNIAEQIAKSEGLSEHDICLAKVCGLLHDIARFRQVKEFDTFNDRFSFDHGIVGAEILKENNYIAKYLEDEEDQKICIKSVKNHNNYCIEDGLSEKELYFAKLVRDSDKIDILETQRNYVRDGQREIDPLVLDSIRNKKLFKINKEKKVTANVSEIAVCICFIFDMNFKKSFQIIKEKGLIERKLQLLKDNCDSNVVCEIENIVNLYIESKI